MTTCPAHFENRDINPDLLQFKKRANPMTKYNVFAKPMCLI